MAQDERSKLPFLRPYELLSEVTRDIVLFVRPEGSIVEANRAAVLAYGYDHRELLELTICDLQASPNDADAELLPSGKADGHVFESVQRRKDGSAFPVEISVSPSQFGNLLLYIIRDITERKQLEMMRAALRKIDQAILHKKCLSRVLQYICDQLVDVYGFPVAWMGVRNRNGTVSVRAKAGSQCHILDSMQVHWADDPLGQGPTGVGLRTGKPQQAEIRDSSVKPWCQALQACGITSALSFPLSVESESWALTIYTDDAHPINPEVFAELSRFADQTALCVYTAKDQQRTQWLYKALLAPAHGVVVLDADSCIQWANPVWEEITGYALEEVEGCPYTFLDPGIHSPESLTRIIKSVMSGQDWRGDIHIRHKDGGVRSVRATFIPVQEEPSRAIQYVVVVEHGVSDSDAHHVFPATAAKAACLEEHAVWQGRIQNALQHSKFILLYQPVIRLDAGTPHYHEVLLRMQDDDDSLVSATTLLHHAERLHMMTQIDLWVFRTALNILKQSPAVNLAINLSSQTMENEQALETIAKHLRANRSAAHHLILEISEAAVFRNLLNCQRWMRHVNRIGCRFALDNFGSGHSSFPSLRLLPLDYIKLDGPLVRKVDTDPVSRALVKAVRQVANSLEVKTVAEWVENQKVADVLKELNVPYAQGNWLGSPSLSIPSPQAH